MNNIRVNQWRQGMLIEDAIKHAGNRPFYGYVPGRRAKQWEAPGTLLNAFILF